MKTLGLIGGMSWESTAIYYRRLNELARERLGGLHSAKLLLHSFDFAEIEALQAAGDWAGAGGRMADAARALERGGAEALVICTNTMHKLAPAVRAASALPLLHIADATAGAMRAAGVRRPLLLATRYTMEQDFYSGRLAEHGFDVVVPEEPGRTAVHRIIYEELCVGRVEPASRRRYLEIVRAHRERDGIDAVIFGCTEVGMLLSADDLELAAFDTTELHARAAMDFALSGEPSGTDHVVPISGR